MIDLDLVARASENPGSPLAFGVAILILVHLATKTPYLSAPFRWVVVRFGLSDVAIDRTKRVLSVALSFAPGLALVLAQHMSWNAALRTALLTWLVSQGWFLVRKAKPEAAAVLVFFALAISSTACGVDKAKIEHGIASGVLVLEVAKPCLIELQNREEAACSGDLACKAEVRDRWDPVALAYDAFHDMVCTMIDPTAEGCAQ